MKSKIYLLLFIAGLMAGGCSQGPSSPSIMDATAPIIKINSPATNTKTNTSTIHIQGTVDDKLIATVFLTLNGATQNINVNDGSFNAPIYLIKGSNKVKVAATSSSGKTGTSEEILIIFDSDAPQVRITSPSNGLITNNSTIGMSGEVDDTSISTATIIINGDEATIPIVSGAFSKTIILLSGLNTIEAKATDSAGNIGRSGKYETILDNTAPLSSIVIPSAGSIITGSSSSLTIEGTASDGSGTGVISVEISVDNGNTWANAISTGSNFSTWKYNWILPGENDVSHTIKCRAKDGAGNIESPSAGKTVNVDTLSPTLSNIRTTSITYDSMSNIITNITIQWETNEPSTSQIEYGETTSCEILASIDETKETNHSFIINGINFSDFNYKVRSKDAAGNETISDNCSPILLIGPGPEGEDTFIRDRYANINFSEGGNGYWPTNGNRLLYFGLVDTGYPKIDRALIKFDLSSIPSNATIINSRLKLYMCSALTDGADLTLEAHEALKQWTEAGATWNKYDGTNSWDLPGGDYSPSVEGKVTIPWMGIKYIEITDLAKAWFVGAKINNGLLLKAENETEYNSKGCNSFEYAGVEQRPKLKVIYTQP